jgi:hypothetical protein
MHFLFQSCSSPSCKSRLPHASIRALRPGDCAFGSAARPPGLCRSRHRGPRRRGRRDGFGVLCRKQELDLSVGIALGSAAQIALFVAPVLVLVGYLIGPKPMDLQFWEGAVTMMLIAAMTASLVTNAGRSAWFAGARLPCTSVSP